MTAFLHNPAPLHPLRVLVEDDPFPESWAQLALDQARNNAELFVRAGTIAELASDRRGQVLVELFFPEVAVALQAEIAARAPKIFEALGLPQLEVVDVEVQLTRYGEGDFYGCHFDCDDHALEDRAVAWLWYLRSAPQPFTGGALRLYHTTLEGGRPRLQREVSVDVEPRHNRLACFDTRQMHEVMPVYGANEWMAGRFTVNGWIRAR